MFFKKALGASISGLYTEKCAFVKWLSVKIRQVPFQNIYRLCHNILSLINQASRLYLSACLYNKIFDWPSVAPPSAGIVLGAVKWYFIRWNGLGFVSIVSLKTALNVHGRSKEIQRWGYFYNFAILEFRYFWPFFAVFFFHQNTTTHQKDRPFSTHNFLVNKQLCDNKFKWMFFRYPWKPRKILRMIVGEG